MEQTIEEQVARQVGELMRTIGYPPIKNGSVTLHFDSNGVCNHVEMKVTRKLRQTPRPGN